MPTTPKITTAIQTTWSETATKFSETQYTWGEVALVQEIYSHAKNTGEFEEWQRKNKEKQQAAIRLYCKVAGKEYNKTKYRKKFKLTINHAHLLIKEVLKIEVKTIVKNT